MGSTPVEGLAAKPIIDMDIVIADRKSLPDVLKRLEKLGYTHRGDLGIPDRESFKAPETSTYKHNLYVCLEGSLALQNHRVLRDSLRKNPSLVQRYGALKQELAQKFPESIDLYVDGKTEFIVSVLKNQISDKNQLDAIRDMNLLAKNKESKSR